MEKEIILRVIALIFIPFFVVVFVTPFIKKVAEHVGALDIPNERKVHKVPIPRLGGIGIYFGFLVGYMFFGEATSIMNSILIGSFILILTGAVDDIKPLKPLSKFIGQLLAALVITVYGGILIKDIDAFGMYLNFGILAYPLSVFFILGCINCMNFIDGLDGLASGISSIFFLSTGVIAACKCQLDLPFLMTFIMLGSCIGFLVYNFNPASIFMGDSGSMFLGFIMSVITMLGYKNVMMSSIIIPLLLLSVPILDTLFAILRRKLKGESVSKPDKSHIHHQFLKRGFSQRGTALTIYIITFLFAAASVIYVLVDNLLGYIIYGILLFAFIVFALKTDILFSKNKKIGGGFNNEKKSTKKRKK